MGKIAIAILIAVLLPLVWLWFRFQPGDPADGAAWAQAISSVAAIAAALFVVIWQHHLQVMRDEASRKQARAERLEAAFQLGEYVRVVAVKVIKHASGKNADRIYLTNAAGELQAIGTALGKYHPADFYGYRELKSLMAVMSATAALAQQLEHALTIHDPYAASAMLHQGFGGAIENLTANARELKEVADEARNG
jgi:hypothetical protein